MVRTFALLPLLTQRQKQSTIKANLGKKSSSETTSEISLTPRRNFEMFNNYTYKKISSDWLTWFIGFTDGAI